MHIAQFFKDKHGKIVLFQRPNLPIIGWIAFLVLSKITTGTVQDVTAWLSFVLLVFWALLEIIWGVSPFRRLLGIVILAASVVNRILL